MTLELVLGDLERVIGVRGFPPDDAFAFALKSKFTHDPSHSRTTATYILFNQARMNSGNAVGFAAVLEDGFDLKAQVFPFFGAFGFRSSLPFVVPAFADLERPAHDFEIELGAVLLDEVEF